MTLAELDAVASAIGPIGGVIVLAALTAAIRWLSSRRDRR